MEDTIHVTGLKELGKMLDDLPDKITNNIMRGALRAGATLIQTDVKANCPIGDGSNKEYGNYPGALRDSIKVRTKKKDKYVRADVQAGGNFKNGVDIYWAHIIEFTGAAPHQITAKNRKILSFGGAFFQSVHHPGMQPKPFMRPALDKDAQAAVVVVGNYIKNKLTKRGLEASEILVEGDE